MSHLVTECLLCTKYAWDFWGTNCTEALNIYEHLKYMRSKSGCPLETLHPDPTSLLPKKQKWNRNQPAVQLANWQAATADQLCLSLRFYDKASVCQWPRAPSVCRPPACTSTLVLQPCQRERPMRWRERGHTSIVNPGILEGPFLPICILSAGS